MLLGADEIANQLEDPFQLIPVQPLLEACVGDVRRWAGPQAPPEWLGLQTRRCGLAAGATLPARPA